MVIHTHRLLKKPNLLIRASTSISLQRMRQCGRVILRVPRSPEGRKSTHWARRQWPSSSMRSKAARNCSASTLQAVHSRIERDERRWWRRRTHGAANTDGGTLLGTQGKIMRARLCANTSACIRFLSIFSSSRSVNCGHVGAFGEKKQQQIKLISLEHLV